MIVSSARSTFLVGKIYCTTLCCPREDDTGAEDGQLDFSALRFNYLDNQWYEDFLFSSFQQGAIQVIISAP